MHLRHAELARRASKAVVGLPERVTKQEAFERSLRLLPAGKLVAVENKAIVIRKDYLFFVLGGDAVELVAKPCVFKIV